MRLLTKSILPRMKDTHVVIGEIRAPHGIYGAVSVTIFSNSIDDFISLEHCILYKEGHTLVTSLVYLHANRKYIVLRIPTITTIEQAKKWQNADILLEHKYLHPCKPNEYFINDLIQAKVIYNTEVLGTVLAVKESTNYELLEVECIGTSKRYYVPFSEQFVGEVDIENKTIELKHRWILED